MFRFFHNTVHVCTRSLACSALLQVPCTSSRCTHDQEAKETALREIPSPNGHRRCTVPGKHLPGRSCTSTVCDSSKTARSQTPRSRYGSARLPAPAEQHPYNLIYTYLVHIIRLHLSQRVGFRSYTSHILAHTCMFRQERAAMS